MGKLIFTPLQMKVFEEFSKNSKFRQMFYFGGGTALSVFYLKHRLSEDLDFFNEEEIDEDLIIRFMNGVANRLGISVKMTKKEMIIWFELKSYNEFLKIDFIHFPYPRIDQGIIYNGLSIDSPRDIAANKILTLNLNREVKDYVDLYFLLKEKFSIWDILYAVEAKFRLKLDLIALGEDFLEADKVEFLPKMIKPLTLNNLKAFFRQKAQELGKKAVE